MVNIVNAPSLSQARRDANTQKINQMSALQQLAHEQQKHQEFLANRANRDRLAALQLEGTETDIRNARSREERLNRQESRLDRQDRRQGRDFDRKAFLGGLPLLNQQAKRLRQIPEGPQLTQEALASENLLRQAGIDPRKTYGIDANGVTHADLDRIIQDTDVFMQKMKQADPERFGRVFEAEGAGGERAFYTASDRGNVKQLSGITPVKGVQERKFEKTITDDAEKAEARARDAKRQAQLVVFDIDRALEQSEGVFTTGFTGSIASAISGTPAHDLKMTLEPIKANIAFEELQKMRDNSPTGGALGSVQVRELELLQSTLGSVEQSQSREQVQRNLTRLKTLFDSVVHGTNAIPFSREEYDSLPSGSTYIDPSDGLTYRKP